MQSEFLECTSIIKEYTTNFHSDGILAHSGTSVTRLLHKINYKKCISVYELWKIYSAF